MSKIENLREEINTARTRLGLAAFTPHQLAAIIHAQAQFEAFVQGAVNPTDYRLCFQVYGVDVPTDGLEVAEAKQEHVVKLQPFGRTPAGDMPSTETGPFTDRAEAERTLRGAMTTGRFASGTIVTREEGGES